MNATRQIVNNENKNEAVRLPVTMAMSTLDIGQRQLHLRATFEMKWSTSRSFSSSSSHCCLICHHRICCVSLIAGFCNDNKVSQIFCLLRNKSINAETTLVESQRQSLVFLSFSCSIIKTMTCEHESMNDEKSTRICVVKRCLEQLLSLNENNEPFHTLACYLAR
jgi:hypothetical protein